MLDLGEVTTLTPYQAIGIPIALVGGVFLALGAQFQHRGVAKVEASHGSGVKHGLNTRQLKALLGRPSWVAGTIMLALAIALQLTSLIFAPLIVVQPLGVIALVITAILNSRISRVKLDRPTIRSLILCVVGVGAFVTIATMTATERVIRTEQLTIILIILGVVTLAYAIAFAVLRKKMKAVFYIVGAGVLYGFVATLAKVVINRVINGNFELLTLFGLLALVGAVALGAYFVQNAYAVGSPDLVIAGLTVIDPMVAVGIGIVVLGEASGAPLWAVIGFLMSGAVAIYGVFMLAKHHPQTHR
ncbi:MULTISPECIES: DMT family transporter [unclassified Diaminobutyricimonas]|uniref:DMT family transporter n=1 Tax=unclassified Diaminobutyricimonas TaxID=2643261 RepID=UPI0012F52060|nr:MULTISPECIES: DMT family transporter [unclassified Diaminobutyricimonas]